jgi:capsule biosynthesis phosphatase
MIFSCDVDDTICFATNRDYANGKPDLDLIAILNRKYDQGHTVVYYTARGMRTCGEDLNRIELEVRPILETWLAKHGVKYHQLRMGKQFADIYIDDKAKHPNDFKADHDWSCS